MGLTTLTFREFYDYERCPKIVAYKAYRELHLPPRARIQSAQVSIERNLAGKVAEIAVKEAFAGGDREEEFDQKTFERSVLRSVSACSHIIDDQVLALVRSTIAGVARVREKLLEAYGEVRVLGKGQSRSGLAPALGLFDFVALHDRGPPVIVEVKNLERAHPGIEGFQAAFYNTLAEKFGVMVLTERVENGVPTVIPVPMPETPAETILIQARLGSFEVVKNRVDLSPERVASVWAARQLGFRGRFPSTDCDPSCPHHRLTKSFAEDTIEPAIPLPLAYAAAQLEHGTDFDILFLQSYFSRSGELDILRPLRWAILEADRIDRPDRAELVLANAAAQLNLDAGTLVDYLKYRPPMIDSIEKDLSDVSKAWGKLLGKKIRTVRPRAIGLSRRFFSIPNASGEFIRKCSRAWRH